MLDLTKPLRHKETKAEARVVFVDQDTSTAWKYLVVTRQEKVSGWVSLHLGDDDPDGPWLSFSDLETFLENTPTKITGEAWVNVYEGGVTGRGLFTEKRQVDFAAHSHRIARIKLPFTAEEGQFDE